MDAETAGTAVALWVAAETAKPLLTEAAKRVLDADYLGNARAVLRRLQERGGIDQKAHLPPGLALKLLEEARYLDDEILQDLWAELIAAGLEGAKSPGDIAWAARELPTITGGGAVMMALYHQARWALNDVPHEPLDAAGRELVSAGEHLAARGWVEHDKDAGRLWSNHRAGLFDPNIERQSIQGLAVYRLRFKGQNRQWEGAGERFSLSQQALEFSKLVGIRPLEDYGRFQPALVERRAAREFVRNAAVRYNREHIEP